MKSKHKRLMFAVLIFVLVGSLILFFSPMFTVQAALLSGYIYRKSHLITNSTGANTNYQVTVHVYYGSGIDSGEDVYTSSHCQTDFDDIRFTDDDGSTELNYWLETKTDSNNARFWVKVTDNLTSANQTIYVYYGNSTVTTTSNGDNTFLFFDDFPGASLNTTKWAGNTASASVSNSILTMTGTTSDKSIISNTTYYPNTNTPSALRFNGSLPASTWAMTGLSQGQAGPERCHIYSQNTVASLMSDSTVVNSNWTRGVYGIFDICAGSAHTHFYENRWNGGGECQNSPINDPCENALGVWVHIYGTGKYNYVDWIFRRSFVDPEPTHSTWGNEESSDSTSPIYDDSTLGKNATNGEWVCLFYVNCSDAGGLSFFALNHNSSGSYANETFTSFGANTWANDTLTLPAVGIVLSWNLIFNDTSNNWNTTMPYQNFTCTFYTSISINTGTHGWSITPGQSNITITEGTISLTITANANFDVEAKSWNASLSDGTNTIALTNLLMHKDTLASAIVVTTDYQDIPELTNQAKGTDVAKSFVLWLSCPTGRPVGNYVYVLNVQVTQT